MDPCEVDGELCARGTQNQVLRQNKAFGSVSTRALRPPGDEVTACLNGMDGFRATMYAVGDAGAIWHWDGKGWQASAAPTNQPPHCARCRRWHPSTGGSRRHPVTRQRTGRLDRYRRPRPVLGGTENMVEFAGVLM